LGDGLSAGWGHLINGAVTALGELLITILALAKELRLGTIDRVMEKSDIELGVDTSFEADAQRPDRRRWPGGGHIAQTWTRRHQRKQGWLRGDCRPCP